MSDEIGKLVVNVGLDSTGFQNGITNINRQMRVVQSEFQAAAAKLGDFGKSTESLGLKADSLTKQIELQRQKVQALDAAFQQSAEAKGNDAKATQDLQIKLNKAQAQLSTMENELKSTTAQIKEQESTVKSQSGAWTNFAQAFSKSESDIRSGLARIGETIKTTLVFGTVYKGLGLVKDGFDAVIGGGIKFDSTMQQNQIAFTTMLGSAQKAKDLMSQLTNMAAVTPFETADLTQASRTLLAFGVTSNQVIPTLKMLGDVSQGDKQRFDSLTLAFAQIQSAGKMQGQDLLQLVSAGFNPLQIIAQKTGKSMAELRTEMANGAISADMVTKAFQDATSKGGMFYNAMQNQSTTFDGLMSTLKDNLNTTFGQVMKPVFDWMTNTALPKAIDMTTKFTDALKQGGAVQAFKTILPANVVDGMVTFGKIVKDTFNFIKQNGAEIAKDMLAIGAAIVTFKTLSTAVSIFQAIKKATQEVTIAQLALNAVMEINPFIAIGTAVVAASVLIYTHWAQIKSFLTDTWNAIQNTATAVWNSISNFFTTLWASEIQGITTVWNGIVSFITGVWNGIKQFALDVWNGIKNAVVGAFEWMYNHNYYFKNLVDFIQNAWNTIKQDAAIIWNGIKDFFSSIWNAIKSAAEEYWNLEVTFFKTIWNGIVSVANAIWTPIKAFFTGIWENIKNATLGAWDSIKNYIVTHWSDIYSSITEIGTKIGGFFTNLWNEAKQWGENLINMFVQGIENTIHKVEDAVKNVAGTITHWLGFHSPSAGLPDSDQWAPNFVKMFAGGLLANIPLVSNAVQSLTNPIQTAFTSLGSAVDTLTTKMTTGFTTISTQAQQMAQQIQQAAQSMDYALGGLANAPGSSGSNPNNVFGHGYAYTDSAGIDHVVGDLATAQQYSGNGKITDYNGHYGTGYALDNNGNRIHNNGSVWDTIPKLATGGIINRATVALTGEAGPEAVLPLNNGVMGRLATAIISKMGGTFGGKQPINIYMDSQLIGSYVWNAAAGDLQLAQRKGF